MADTGDSKKDKSGLSEPAKYLFKKAEKDNQAKPPTPPAPWTVPLKSSPQAKPPTTDLFVELSSASRFQPS